MSELPAPVARKPVHTRTLRFEGFLREDDLWDLDCELCDTKAEAVTLHERGLLPPGEPVHLLRVRLTIDDSFTIRAVQTAATKVPFGECQVAAQDPMQKLVGLTMGRGWRKAIEGAIGGVAGCTHLRELVFNAATAAFQMVPHYREMHGGGTFRSAARSDQPPFYMGNCFSWRLDGPVVLKFAPQFHRKKDAAS